MDENHNEAERRSRKKDTAREKMKYIHFEQNQAGNLKFLADVHQESVYWMVRTVGYFDQQEM